MTLGPSTKRILFVGNMGLRWKGLWLQPGLRMTDRNDLPVRPYFSR
jgi:hypothetical protein